jgi:hypothetical protein
VALPKLAQLPVRRISATAPKAIASSFFHGSWPTRPGSSQATQTIRKSAVLTGVRVPSNAIGFRIQPGLGVSGVMARF